MTLNWQQEAAKYKDQMLTDLTSLLKINSARDVEHKEDDAPLGPGPRDALLQMLAIADRDGFTTKNIENVAGRIEFGSGDEIFGILGHVDVVPLVTVGKQILLNQLSKTARFMPVVLQMTKAHQLRAYYALKLLKDNDIKLNKKVHFIFGTDEESEWVGINRYLEVEPKPDFAISPDANFPIINGEKGIVSYMITFKPVDGADGEMTLVSFKSGLRANMVPQTAKAILTGAMPPDFQAKFDAYVAEHKLQGTITTDGDQTVIDLIGKGSHAQEPKAGVNAATHLATFLADFALDAKGGNYIGTIARLMHEDSRGHLLNINHTDDVMGDLTACPAVFNYTQDGVASVLLNVRYPKGVTDESTREGLAKTLSDVADVTIEGHAQAPHYVPGDDELVATLLQVFEDQTGLKGHEQVIGGGTYGRILERGVAFGALPEERENVMHQANEYMHIEDIMNAIAIYADAIYRLTR
ncbi:dipeptidase PepV [Latilactobacillus sakei]